MAFVVALYGQFENGFKDSIFCALAAAEKAILKV
jgi:hypothetical protein